MLILMGLWVRHGFARLGSPVEFAALAVGSLVHKAFGFWSGWSEAKHKAHNVISAGLFLRREGNPVETYFLAVLQDVKYYSEETEVDLRDPGKDYELYKQTCEELQRLMAEIQDLKSKGSKDSVRRDLWSTVLVKCLLTTKH